MIRLRQISSLFLLTAAFLAMTSAYGESRTENIDDEFLSKMIHYSETLERRILSEGRPLTEAEREIARRANVKNVNRVRVLILDAVPLPNDVALQQYLAEFGFLRLIRGARGTTKGYGVILTRSGARRPTDLAHELIHVGQYERCGGIAALMQYHLPDLKANGYRRSELEDEAYRLAPKIINSTVRPTIAS